MDRELTTPAPDDNILINPNRNWYDSPHVLYKREGCPDRYPIRGKVFYYNSDDGLIIHNCLNCCFVNVYRETLHDGVVFSNAIDEEEPVEKVVYVCRLISIIQQADFVLCKCYDFDNSDGEVLSKKRNKILKPIIKKTGYKYIFLYNKNGMKKHYIHLLVISTFKGKKKEGQECRHLDGNCQNNNINNLKWGTKKENANDKRKHGTIHIGEKASCVKLTEKDVRWIRLQRNLSIRKMAFILNVSHTCVKRAKDGKTWAHI